MDEQHTANELQRDLRAQQMLQRIAPGDAQMGVERQIPEDLEGLHTVATSYLKCGKNGLHFREYTRLKMLIERIADLAAEVERLKHLLRVSEDYRKAYQDGKYKLYAMGGEICEAAAEHLPMSEGPLDRACRKALGTDQQLQPKGEPVKRGWSEYMKKYGREEYGLDEGQPKGEQG